MFSVAQDVEHAVETLAAEDDGRLAEEEAVEGAVEGGRPSEGLLHMRAGVKRPQDGESSSATGRGRKSMWWERKKVFECGERFILVYRVTCTVLAKTPPY